MRSQPPTAHKDPAPPRPGPPQGAQPLGTSVPPNIPPVPCAPPSPPLSLADGGDEDDYGCSGEEDVSQVSGGAQGGGIPEPRTPRGGTGGPSNADSALQLQKMTSLSIDGEWGAQGGLGCQGGWAVRSDPPSLLQTRSTGGTCCPPTAGPRGSPRPLPLAAPPLCLPPRPCSRGSRGAPMGPPSCSLAPSLRPGPPWAPRDPRPPARWHRQST